MVPNHDCGVYGYTYCLEVKYAGHPHHSHLLMGKSLCVFDPVKHVLCQFDRGIMVEDESELETDAGVSVHDYFCVLFGCQ